MFRNNKKKLFPKKVIKSVYALDYQRYWDRGFRGIILDIDNTLVADNAPANRRAKKLIRKQKKIGFKTCILSNSDKERVRAFGKKVKSPYVYKAHKPSPRGFERAMRKMHTDRSNTLFIGDQIFTDILGANNAGIYCILTDVIDENERKQVKIKRIFERPIVKKIKKIAELRKKMTKKKK